MTWLPWLRSLSWQLQGRNSTWPGRPKRRSPGKSAWFSVEFQSSPKKIVGQIPSKLEWNGMSHLRFDVFGDDYKKILDGWIDDHRAILYGYIWLMYSIYTIQSKGVWRFQSWQRKSPVCRGSTRGLPEVRQGEPGVVATLYATAVANAKCTAWTEVQHESEWVGMLAN